jgi:hypothetical protein
MVLESFRGGGGGRGWRLLFLSPEWFRENQDQRQQEEPPLLPDSRMNRTAPGISPHDWFYQIMANERKGGCLRKRLMFQSGALLWSTI